MIQRRITEAFKAIVWCMLAAIFPVSANAGLSDIELEGLSSQSQFEDLSKQVGIVIGYIPLAPAEPLGITGLDIGIEVTVVDIDQNESFWIEAVQDKNPPSFLVFPRVHAQKGLPFGFDAGLAYATVPGSNIGFVGAELKWAFIRGGIVLPAVALRGSYTRLLGLDDLDLDTYGADLSISKGYAIFTPYAGLGQLWIKSRSNLFEDENHSITKGFIGLKVRLFVVSFVAEIDYIEIPLYNLRANLSF